MGGMGKTANTATSTMKLDTKTTAILSAINYLIKTQDLSPADIYTLIDELIEKAQANRLHQ
jgi:hypothetical protein